MSQNDEILYAYLQVPSSMSELDLSYEQIINTSIGESGYQAANMWISMYLLQDEKWEVPPDEFVDYIATEMYAFANNDMLLSNVDSVKINRIASDIADEVANSYGLLVPAGTLQSNNGSSGSSSGSSSGTYIIVPAQNLLVILKFYCEWAPKPLSSGQNSDLAKVRTTFKTLLQNSKTNPYQSLTSELAKSSNMSKICSYLNSINQNIESPKSDYNELYSAYEKAQKSMSSGTSGKLDKPSDLKPTTPPKPLKSRQTSSSIPWLTIAGVGLIGAAIVAYFYWKD